MRNLCVSHISHCQQVPTIEVVAGTRCGTYIVFVTTATIEVEYRPFLLGSCTRCVPVYPPTIRWLWICLGVMV